MRNGLHICTTAQIVDKQKSTFYKLSQNKCGAIYIDAASPKLAHNFFVGNSCDYAYYGYGGAIFIANANPHITECTFKNNGVENESLSRGGAIYNHQGRPTISKCIFSANNVSAEGGSRGGAIFNDQAKAGTTISDCLFLSNYASSGEYSSGGAISNEGGELHISGCRFSYNEAIGDNSSLPEKKKYSGGAVENRNATVTLQNNFFYSNRVWIIIYELLTHNPDVSGGAVANLKSKVSIANCTLSSNELIRDFRNGPGSAPDDSQFFNGGGLANSSDSEVSVINSILWGNRADKHNQIYNDETSRTDISYSNVDQNMQSDPTISEGPRNMNKNPRFGAGLHLRGDSPCIGAADRSASPEKDIDGESRPAETADIGADQFIDSDQDRMPDYWETRYTLTSASDDGDNDSLTNLDEYHLGTDPNQAQRIADASLSGGVHADGRHNASESLAVIDSDDHAFFAFNVSQTKTVTQASLRLKVTNYESREATRIQIWDVSTPESALRADASGQDGISIYKDLGSGLLYNDYLANPFDHNTILIMPLNYAAIEAINTAIKESKPFIIGLDRVGPSYSRITLGRAGDEHIHQLVMVED